MKKFLIIGLGSFGVTIVETLAAKGADVVAVDIDRNKVEEVKNIATESLSIDTTNEEALKRMGLESIDVAVVAIGENIESSILTTALLKRLGVTRIVARAVTSLHGQILKEVGARNIVSLEADMGTKIANQLLSGYFMDQIEIADGYSIVSLKTKDDFIGKTLKELDLRKKFGINVVIIKKMEPSIDEEGKNIIKERVNHIPMLNDKIESNDILVVVGSNNDLSRFMR